MLLKEFVETVLTEISEGVANAKKGATEHAAIASGAINGRLKLEPKLVKFDIAVSTEETNSAQAEGKAKIFVASGGIEGKSQSIETRINRISFSVPYITMQKPHATSR